MKEIKEILKERGDLYGEFEANATFSQFLKTSMRVMNNWAYLKADQREALEMIAHKISRILTGDSNHIDSWIDVAGYAQLVVDRLAKDGTEKQRGD